MENSRESQAKWYVLHTYSGYEMMVKSSLEQLIENNNLQDSIFDLRIPMEQTIEETGGVNLEALIEKYAGFLPESFRQSLAESVQGLAGSQAPDLADKIVGQVLEPLTTPMISLVIFFVALALFRLVVGFLVALLKGANHIPVLGGVNRTMGFCLGLLAGAVDVYILLCALFALMTLTAGQLPWLNQEILADSWGLRLFNDINPFL